MTCLKKGFEFVSKKDYRISLIRLFSFLFIFSCHVMQYLDIELAWWFNVGVQIFLFISGYLYGGKDVSDCVSFYKRSFLKILLPYYIVIIPVLVIHFVFLKDISLYSSLFVLFTVNRVKGGEHLWFVPMILLCYTITPLICQIGKAIDEKGYRLYCKILFTMAILCLVCYLYLPAFNEIWLFNFLLGFFLGRFQNRIVFLKKLVLIGSLSNLIQIYFDYVSSKKLSEHLLYSKFCNLNHVFLGAALFYLGMWLFSHIDFNKHAVLKKIADFSDRYSYSAYLVHQFIILGPLSLMKMTRFVPLNILVIFALTILLAMVVKLLSDMIENKGAPKRTLIR